MTRVVYKKNHGHYFECTGHSNYDKNGKDLVCAAVSTLCCTLANSLMEKGIEPIAYEDGAVVIRTSEEDLETSTIFHTVMIGFDCLAEQYGDYIEIF